MLVDAVRPFAKQLVRERMLPVAQIAFIGAVLAGVWLLISMLRSRNL